MRGANRPPRINGPELMRRIEPVFEAAFGDRARGLSLLFDDQARRLSLLFGD
jgi:hypothetical protein